MDYDIWTLLIGGAAGLICGLLNTVASSGSAVSLPILIAIGLDPLTANATNRIPVLVGALSATALFHRKGALPWLLAAKAAVPTTLGAVAGAWLADIVPSHDLVFAIAAALLVAVLLLFTKLKAALENEPPASQARFGARQAALFFAIGVWLGFIVLDGATYLLLALVLSVGLPLLQANAIKSFVLVPTAAIAIVVFAIDGAIDWTVAAAMAVGSVFGGLIGARLAASPAAKRLIFVLLVLVLAGEFAHLVLHDLVVG